MTMRVIGPSRAEVLLNMLVEELDRLPVRVPEGVAPHKLGDNFASTFEMIRHAILQWHEVEYHHVSTRPIRMEWIPQHGWALIEDDL